MESSENSDEAARPDHRAEGRCSRGRKRGSTVLARRTVDSEVGVCRTEDSSLDRWIDFKRCRTEPLRNLAEVHFKKPRALPKRRHRAGKPTSKQVKQGSPSQTEEVSEVSPSSAPAPVLRKDWADYDEEDERRIYEEDPSSLFSELEESADSYTLEDLHPEAPTQEDLPAEAPTQEDLLSEALLASTDSEDLMEDFDYYMSSSCLWGVKLSVEETQQDSTYDRPDFGWIDFREKEEEEEEDLKLGSHSSWFSREEYRMMRFHLYSLLRGFDWDFGRKRRQQKQRAIELIRREDGRRREQRNTEGLQEQDLLRLFRDIEQSKHNTSRETTDDFLQEKKKPSLCEDLDVKVARFVFLGNQQVIKDETEHLRRYEKILEEWCNAFKSLDHIISDCVGKILEEMLTEVRRHIMYLTKLGQAQPQCFLPSKHCSGMSLSSFRKLKKKMLVVLRLYMADLQTLNSIQDRWFSLLSLDRYRPTSLCSFGKQFQSRSGKKGHNVGSRNTRKWFRRLHTQKAAGARGRSRRGLKNNFNLLLPQFSHRASVSLKEGDIDDSATVLCLKN